MVPAALRIVKLMANRRIHDEILYCDRCGISFVWSVEEQRAQEPESAGERPTPTGAGPTAAGDGKPGASPPLCPGCRLLLPARGRERGMVKWYSMRKRYGFLVRRDQAELFVAASALQGVRLLQSGDLVEFSLGANEQGPIAEAVRVVAAAADVNVPLPEEPAPRGRFNAAARSRRL